MSGELILRLAHRRSPGPFSARELDHHEERALLAAARVAPSANNAQTWRFISVRAAETKALLSEAVPIDLADAPLVLVVCGVQSLLKSAKREQPFVMIDVPIAVTHLLLQAAELGLACRWTLDCDEERVRRVLGIPRGVRVVALLALGW